MSGLRIRSLKPEFFESESVARLCWPARILLAGMWGFADDHGTGQANMRLIKASVMPLEDSVTLEDVSLWFKEIAENDETIHLFSVDGKDYYHFPKWSKHQSAAFRRNKPIHPEHGCIQSETELNQTVSDEDECIVGGGRGEGEGKGRGGGISPDPEGEI